MPSVNFEDSSIKIDQISVKQLDNVNPGWTFNKDRDKFYYSDSNNVLYYDLLTGETVTIYPNIKVENYLFVDPYNTDQLYIFLFEKGIRFLTINLLDLTIKDRCRVVENNIKQKYVVLGVFFFQRYLLIFTGDKRRSNIEIFYFSHLTKNSFLNILTVGRKEDTKLFCDEKKIYYSSHDKFVEFLYEQNENTFSIDYRESSSEKTKDDFQIPINLNFRFCYRILPLLRTFKLIREEYPLVFDKIVVFEIIKIIYPRVKQKLFQILFDYVCGTPLSKEKCDYFLFNSVIKSL